MLGMGMSTQKPIRLRKKKQRTRAVRKKNVIKLFTNDKRPSGSEPKTKRFNSDIMHYIEESVLQYVYLLKQLGLLREVFFLHNPMNILWTI